MGMFSFLLLPFAVPIAIYLFFILRRFCVTVGLAVAGWRKKLLLWVIAAALALAGMMLSWMGAIFLLHLVVFAGIVQLVNFILKKSARGRYESGFALWRRVYGLFLVPLVLSLAVMVGGYINLHTVRETAYTLHTDKQIRTEGYRVALIADVHFGVSLDAEELAEKCAEISAKKPDLVILCGDIVDNSTTREGMYAVFCELGKIESTYGVFYVHGNHDRPMRIVASAFTEAELVAAIEQNGITVLQDEVVQITEDLVLVGREDRSAARGEKGRASIAELLSAVELSDFVLTLDHQPNQYAENGAAGTDLLLSGHTHGGQIFPLDILQEIVPFNDAVYGLYDIDDDSKAIVTSGFAGWAFPIKTAAPAEYVIIDILPKK
ncbi:MAG: hypothetical protein E7624_02035 [Ruminococcaceae bacterium]|nr:hypothetical protein [Oscillospiraceae bacterium]